MADGGAWLDAKYSIGFGGPLDGVAVRIKVPTTHLRHRLRVMQVRHAFLQLLCGSSFSGDVVHQSVKPLHRAIYYLRQIFDPDRAKLLAIGRRNVALEALHLAAQRRVNVGQVLLVHLLAEHIPNVQALDLRRRFAKPGLIGLISKPDFLRVIPKADGCRQS